MTRITEQIAMDLQLAGLPQDAPYAIQNVSYGFFSVARHYGGAMFQGHRYTYFAESDELVRDDVLKHLKKTAKKAKKQPAEPTQKELM